MVKVWSRTNWGPSPLAQNPRSSICRTADDGIVVISLQKIDMRHVVTPARANSSSRSSTQPPRIWMGSSGKALWRSQVDSTAHETQAEIRARVAAT